MRAERFGSYSMAATFAGIPVFSRRKSTCRYFCAWPPPRCQAVISPCEFRPPVRFCDSTSDFSGVCLVISLLSSMVRKRRDGVYGLNVLIGIGASTYPLLCSAKFRLLRFNFLSWLKYFPRTRSSFRLRRGAHTLSSSRCENLRRVPGGGTCHEKWPCARDPLSP